MVATEHAPKTFWKGSAILSPCTTYRYVLSRDVYPPVAPMNRVVWIGLNPSTANAYDDDATIRKLKGFAERWGYHALDIVNVFAYRTKSPKVLLQASREDVDIVGPENDLHLGATIAQATRVVACWGACPLTKSRRKALAATLGAAKDMGIPVLALKLTADGDPWHPLYVGYDQKLFPFTLE